MFPFRVKGWPDADAPRLGDAAQGKGPGVAGGETWPRICEAPAKEFGHLLFLELETNEVVLDLFGCLTLLEVAPLLSKAFMAFSQPIGTA